MLQKVSLNQNSVKILAVDAAGNLYFADRGNNRIRKVDTRGIITRINRGYTVVELTIGSTTMGSYLRYAISYIP